ncbi:putative membrane protein [Mycobacterium ulcerans str. Harvey]|uniref:Membrane protein n=1 Tax=Mycobacterium ulcerans str. Harvey TaxID=1299332 RepID=A0ABN0QPX8_MYCUL|nr:putative membrane protein [Mycobacterium ulcerans str. Harvey]
MPKVAVAAIALIMIQLGFAPCWRSGVFLLGRFDPGRPAGTQDLLSATYLFEDHDGHVMPGAFLVAGIIIRLMPLDWTGPAISLVVLQLLASLALLRALYVILGWRRVLLIPLTFALFTPLGVPGFAWWAAALNSLPLLAALAWVCGDAILLIRTGNQRYAVSAVLAYFAGLLFFEKAAVVPFVAFAVSALVCHVGGDKRPLRTAWQAGIRLWTAALALTAGWMVLYLAVVDQKRWSGDLAMTWDLLCRSITHGIVGAWPADRGAGIAGPGVPVGDAAAGGDGARMAGAGRATRLVADP